MRRGRLAGMLALWAAAAAVGLASCALEEGTARRALVHGGRERSYLLHVPPSLPTGQRVALVLAFHGGGSNGRQTERGTGWSRLADEKGFLVCYPEGVARQWNDGRMARDIESQVEGVDDVGFVSVLLDEILRLHPVDPGRVYATGISNGAIFSHSLAAALSDRIVAIAPIVGGMAPSVFRSFAPSTPVSVMVVQGTDDPLVPFLGGPIGFGRQDRGKVVDTYEAVRKWVAHDGCGGGDPGEPGTIEPLPDADPGDGTTTRRIRYGGGREGTEVLLYVVQGGGHTWPGGPQYVPAWIIGRASRDWDSTREIWDFFARHSRPAR